MTTSSTIVIKKLLLLLLVLAGLYYAEEFLIPLLLGALLATLLLPMCQWLEHRKINRLLASLLCLLVLLLFIAGLGALLGWQISKLTDDVVLLKQKAGEAVYYIQQLVYHTFGISLKDQSEMILNQQATLSGYLEVIAGSMLSIFTGFILTMVYVVLLLFYRTHIKNFLFKLTAQIHRDETEQLIYRATRVSQHYLSGLSKMIFCLWVMYGIGFSVVGVKNALFFAILCGLLEIVPFIGNITGTTITVLVAAAQGLGFPVLGGIVITYGVVQFIQGWVLEPLIVGPHVKINPLFTIIALVLGEIIWGIPGIVLAIPLTAIFKIICDQIEPLKPYGFLIGEIEDKKESPGYIKKIKLWFKRD